MPTTLKDRSAPSRRTARLLMPAVLTAWALATLGGASIARATTVSVQRPPVPGAPRGTLFGLSCASATNCMTVGLTYQHTARVTRALADRWNGQNWSATSFPTGRQNVQLNDVACPSRRSCIAVGMITTLVDHPIAARWNGSRWTLQKVPWPMSYGSVDAASLWGVSCPAVNSCFAVGDDEDQNTSLAERWNGRRWTIMRFAQPATQSSELWDVSCASSTRCVAVGDLWPGCQVPYLERWNGQAWAIASTANIPGFDGSGNYPCGIQNDSSFSGASCVHSGSCFVVGWRGVAGTNRDIPLVERSGSPLGSWLLQPFPSVSRLEGSNNGGGYLVAVSCTSTRACVGAGAATSANTDIADRSVAMLAQLRGQHWAARSVVTGLSKSALFDVACPTSKVCLAVGSGNNRQQHERPFAVKLG
jgi:hypothetical protein